MTENGKKIKREPKYCHFTPFLFFFRFVRQLYFVVISDSGTNADGKEEKRTDADADADSSFTVSRPQTFPPIQLLPSLAPSSSSSSYSSA